MWDSNIATNHKKVYMYEITFSPSDTWAKSWANFLWSWCGGLKTNCAADELRFLTVLAKEGTSAPLHLVFSRIWNDTHCQQLDTQTAASEGEDNLLSDVTDQLESIQGTLALLFSFSGLWFPVFLNSHIHHLWWVIHTLWFSFNMGIEVAV